MIYHVCSRTEPGLISESVILSSWNSSCFLCGCWFRELLTLAPYTGFLWCSATTGLRSAWKWVLSDMATQWKPPKAFHCHQHHASASIMRSHAANWRTLCCLVGRKSAVPTKSGRQCVFARCWNLSCGYGFNGGVGRNLENSVGISLLCIYHLVLLAAAQNWQISAKMKGLMGSGMEAPELTVVDPNGHRSCCGGLIVGWWGLLCIV